MAENVGHRVEPGERRFYGIDFVDEAEKKVRIIQ
jgi:hypothetical protein